MADFNISIQRVLGNEGGFTNEPNDPGGPTNWGISLRQYKKDFPDADLATMQSLTKDQAIAWYEKKFWIYDGIQDQALADKLLDTAVNQGPEDACTYIQKALVSLYKLPVMVDGVLGSKTVAAINSISSHADLLDEFCAQQAFHYAMIVVKNPIREDDLLGWMRRAVKR